jgi:S1-C subfamily serine protease
MYAAMTEYTKNLQKSMVTLTGITSRVDWFNDVNESSNKSSGIIIFNNTKELLILTNYAPLANAQRLNVTFCNGAETVAEFKRKDPSSGLAVVTVQIEALPENFLEETIAIAKPGSSSQSNLTGTPVIALGCPMGTVNSMGYGVITSSSGIVSEEDVSYKLLQTDIVGSPVADGVLFNLYGQFIGIITHDHSVEGMENLITAYGITDLKKRMEKLSNDQPFSYLGIYGTSVSVGIHEELHVPYGTYVKDVELDSPAMRAGIQKGDVITQMDEYAINNFSDYVSFMNIKNPETEVDVTIMRSAPNGYKEMNVEVTLGELK